MYSIRYALPLKVMIQYVTVGGLMGYVKSGSQKSAIAGGVSAAVLLFVFRELPTKPVLASTIGVGKERTEVFFTFFLYE